MYPLIQIIFTVIKLLRMCLPHELHVDLRVELPIVSKLQLKDTHKHTHTIKFSLLKQNISNLCESWG